MFRENLHATDGPVLTLINNSFTLYRCRLECAVTGVGGTLKYDFSGQKLLRDLVAEWSSLVTAALLMGLPKCFDVESTFPEHHQQKVKLLVYCSSWESVDYTPIINQIVIRSPWMKTARYSSHMDSVFFPLCLTHLGRVTHICVNNVTVIGSDNGLNQCWNNISSNTRSRLQWNLNRNSYIVILENAFEIVYKIASISFRPQYVHFWWWSHNRLHSALWNPANFTQAREKWYVAHSCDYISVIYVKPIHLSFIVSRL